MATAHSAIGADAMEASTAQQESTMKAELQEEYRWLRQLVCQWTFDG